jgi:hypothetical protein
MRGQKPPTAPHDFRILQFGTVAADVGADSRAHFTPCVLPPA